MESANRKRPSAPGAKKGVEPHGNAQSYSPGTTNQVGVLSGPESVHSALQSDAVGTASDMTVKSTKT